MNAGESPISVDLAREPDFRLGGLEVRPSSREVIAGEAREVLEPRVMQVLVALARRRGQVVSRDELVASCWGGRVVGDDAIQRAVAAVRRLGEARGAFAVETVSRVGYRLSKAGPARARPPGPRLRQPAAMAAVLVLLLVGGGLWAAWDRIFPRPLPLRVAVLPFDVSGQDPQAHAFADSLLDTLIGALLAGQVEAVSRTESLALRGPEAAAEIRRLGIGLVLDGIVTSDGKQLSVRVDLEDPRSHATLWSRAFNGPIQDAERLRTQVAARSTVVTQSAASPDSQPIRRDPALLAEYLEATDHNLAGADMSRSLALARDLVARAPGFAGGHAQLAWSIQTTRGELSPDAYAAAAAESMREAKRALAIDPNYGTAYVALSGVAPYSQWRQREALILKGLAVWPNDWSGHWTYSGFLIQAGRAREAVREARRAVALQPYQNSRDVLAMAQALSGRTDEAMATLGEARRMWGEDNPELALAQFDVAVFAAEPSSRERALALIHDPVVVSAFRDLGVSAQVPVWQVTVQALASRDEAGKRAALSLLSDAVANGIVGPSEAIETMAAFGDVDAAFRTAERTFTPAKVAEPARVSLLNTEPLFAPIAAPLRRDRRFMQLADRLGLVDYWITSGQWPDFCAEPGLPYDCKIEAMRLARKHPS